MTFRGTGCAPLRSLAVVALAQLTFAQGKADGLHGPVPYSYFAQDEPLRIGNDVQLLVDDYIVEDRWKLTRRTGKAYKHVGNPVLVPDKPWEDYVAAGNVVYDKAVDKFKMWYMCFNLSNYFSKAGPAYFISYAESSDGYRWVKPELDDCPFGKYRRTNVVFTGDVKLRQKPLDVPLNRNLMSEPRDLFMLTTLTKGATTDLVYSPDGIHWENLGVRLGYHSDAGNQMLWVPSRQTYFMYVRPHDLCAPGTSNLPEGERHVRRRVAVMTSKDLRTFSTPHVVFYPDERDQPDYDGAGVFLRHGVFVMFYLQMHQEKGNSEDEVYLATSRDGINFQRTWDRKPFVELGPEGAFDHGQLFLGPPLEVEDNFLFYYSGTPYGQSDWGQPSAVGIMKMRKDRFVGQWAGRDATGYLLTRKFTLDGSKLKINCTSLPKAYDDVQSDGIYVEILDGSQTTGAAKPIPGFTLADCDRVRVDQIDKVVTWKKNADLGALKGRPVYLRFKLKDAGLYAFQIAE
jgi:hypothetical protein